jgi:hypothetical protein
VTRGYLVAVVLLISSGQQAIQVHPEIVANLHLGPDASRHQQEWEAPEEFEDAFHCLQPLAIGIDMPFHAGTFT